MIQCFAEKDFPISFVDGKRPQLLSASKIDEGYMVHPRILHKHEDCLEILLVRSGSGVYILDEKQYRIETGDLIICNQGVLHDEAPEKSNKLNIYCCSIGNVYLPGLPPNCLVRPRNYPIVKTAEMFDVIKDLMSTIYFLLAANKEISTEACSYMTMGLVSLVAKIIERRKPDERFDTQDMDGLQILRIKQYINANYDEALTLKRLGEALHLSPYYLAHVFKDKTGYSPAQYIMRRRLGEAQTMLISTDYSITKIANIVGYGNPNHFDVLFTKYVGMSPSKYRKTYVQK